MLMSPVWLIIVRVATSILHPLFRVLLRPGLGNLSQLFMQTTFWMSILFHDNPGTSLGHTRINETENDLESPEWMDDIFPNNSFIDGEVHTKIRGFCRDVLLYEVPILRVRYWDLAIFLPNFLFLLFLLLNIRCVLRRIALAKSPVFKAFFVLIYMTTLVNVLRSTLSMAISATNPFGEIVNKVLWIFVKFIYMTAELSVMTFALLFGHLDSGKSIRRALFVAAGMSLLHTAIQTVLELRLIDKSYTENAFFDLDTQGGLLFWFMTSLTFAFVYMFALCLPLTCVRRYVTLPSKCSFYWYCILFSSLNMLQAFGAALIFFRSPDGMCFVDFTTFIYFCFFTPVVYFTFLRKFLRPSPSSVNGGLFSYRKQKDESGTGGEMVDSYYPRFSGLTSPSYDDLFDCGRDRFVAYDYTRDYLQFEAPLIAAEPAESTVTTRTAGSDEGRNRDSLLWTSSLERQSRQLKGLGANGTLVFEEPRWK